MPVTRQETIFRAAPNGHYVEISRRFWQDGEVEFVVVEGGRDGDYTTEFDNYESAVAYYKTCVAAARVTPNWDAQAEYDAQWR